MTYISSAEVLKRAQYWIDHPPPNGYDQSGTAPDPNGVQYRADCSGYASMCLNIGSSPNSGAFASGVAKSILKSDLTAGDLMVALPNSQASFGHVVVFEHWADQSMTSYMCFEFGHGAAPLHHIVPYPYNSDSRTFKPYRYPQLIPGNVNETIAVNSPSAGEPAGIVSDVVGGTLDTILPNWKKDLLIGVIALVAVFIVITQIG